jgi:hypothetical protein
LARIALRVWIRDENGFGKLFDQSGGFFVG